MHGRTAIDGRIPPHADKPAKNFRDRSMFLADLVGRASRASDNAHENNGKDSTVVWRRRRGDVDRLARAAIFPLAEPSRRFRSDSARQTDVRAGVPVSASSNSSSRSGRLTPPALFPANFRFCIRPLPSSSRDTRWHRRHHKSSRSGDICFFVFAPGYRPVASRSADAGFNASRWKTASMPTRTKSSF